MDYAGIYDDPSFCFSEVEMKKEDVNGRTIYYLKKKKDNSNITLELEEINVIGSNEIKALLDSRSTVFIVDTHLGISLIEGRDIYDFWEKEVKVRLVETEECCDGFSINDYPGGYCYVARKCKNIKSNCDLNNYIILDMYH